MIKGLFSYEFAFKAYTRVCINDSIDDNIQYAEIRPNLSSNALVKDDGIGYITILACCRLSRTKSVTKRQLKDILEA